MSKTSKNLAEQHRSDKGKYLNEESEIGRFTQAVFEKSAEITPGAKYLLKALRADYFQKVLNGCHVEAQRAKALKLGDASTAFSGILRCLIRQLELVSYPALPVEVYALACRIAYEADQRVLLMTKDPGLISDFVAERWFEEADLLDAFRKVSRAQWIDQRKRIVWTQIRDHNLQRPRQNGGQSAAQRARLVHRTQDHESTYAQLSNCVHASAMLCCGEDYWESLKQPFRRLTFSYADRVLGEIQYYLKTARKERRRSASALGSSPNKQIQTE